jgi:hypothetical protein
VFRDGKTTAMRVGLPDIMHVLLNVLRYRTCSDD